MRIRLTSPCARRSYNVGGVSPSSKTNTTYGDASERACDNGNTEALSGVPVLRGYTTVTNQPDASWVTVHYIKSTEGGILDPDDQVASVVDDKEQIVAIYDEQDVSPLPRAADSEAASSQGTSSPDPARDNSVEIRSLDKPPRPGLLVVKPSCDKSPNLTPVSRSARPSETSAVGRRSEETQIIFDSEVPATATFGAKKRQAPKIPNSVSAPIEIVTKEEGRESREGRRLSPEDAPRRFARAGARQSSLERFLDTGLAIHERYDQQRCHAKPTSPLARPNVETEGRRVVSLEAGGGRQLGMQIAPVFDDSQQARLSGVRVSQIHETGRIFADGRIQLHDVITEINERPIYQMSFVRAQSYLHEAWQEPKSLVLTLRRPADRPSSSAAEPPTERPTDSTHGDKNAAPPKAKETAQSALQKANTRKIGHKFTVHLKKGANGLGFTVTSRDTTADEVRPFYVKTVLPRGAANEDGRLRAGDRLLQVNGKGVTGMVQRDVVDMLRSVQEGESVYLVISRHQDQSPAADTSPSIETPSKSTTSEGTGVSRSPLKAGLRRESTDSSTGGLSPLPLPRPIPETETERVWVDPAQENKHSQLHLEIPLNETGSAGLGLSMKGRTAAAAPHRPPADCGIFVKAIMHGGAAHKDGQLRVNDQLVGINGRRLAGMSNERAIRMISDIMQNLSPHAVHIALDVRRSTAPHAAHANSTLSSSGGDTPPLPLKDPPLPLGEPPRTTPITGGEGYGPRPAQYQVGVDTYAKIWKKRDEATAVYDDPKVIIEHDHSPPANNETFSPAYGEIAEVVDEKTAEGANPFDRESTLRQSMSEKRHLAAKNNPSHTDTYKKLKETKHFRQSSAPTLPTVEICSELPESSAAAPLVPSNSANTAVRTTTAVTQSQQRRSMSLESLTRGEAPQQNGAIPRPPLSDPPMVHELAMHGYRDSGRKSTPHAQKRWNVMKKTMRPPANDSFRIAVDRSFHTAPGAEIGVDVGESLTRHLSSSPSSPVTGDVSLNASHSLPREASKSKDRRKSTGAGFFSKHWFRFSGHSRDGSPEKKSADGEKEARERAKRAAQEEQHRIREQYEKLKRQQQEMQSRQTTPVATGQNAKLPSQWRPPSREGDLVGPSPPAQYSRNPSMSPATRRHGGAYLQPNVRMENGQRSVMVNGNGEPYYHASVVYPHPPDAPPPQRIYDEVPWFTAATEHSSFYRSLDRPAQSIPLSRPPLPPRSHRERLRSAVPPPPASGLPYQPSATTYQPSRSANPSQNTSAGGLVAPPPRPPPPVHPRPAPTHNRTTADSYQNFSRRASDRHFSPATKPRFLANSGIVALQKSAEDAGPKPDPPDYQQYLRANRDAAAPVRPLRKTRPASNYYDYRSVSHGDFRRAGPLSAARDPIIETDGEELHTKAPDFIRHGRQYQRVNGLTGGQEVPIPINHRTDYMGNNAGREERSNFVVRM